MWMVSIHPLQKVKKNRIGLWTSFTFLPITVYWKRATPNQLAYKTLEKSNLLPNNTLHLWPKLLAHWALTAAVYLSIEAGQRWCQITQVMAGCQVDYTCFGPFQLARIGPSIIQRSFTENVGFFGPDIAQPDFRYVHARGTKTLLWHRHRHNPQSHCLNPESTRAPCWQKECQRFFVESCITKIKGFSSPKLWHWFRHVFRNRAGRFGDVKRDLAVANPIQQQDTMTYECQLLQSFLRTKRIIIYLLDIGWHGSKSLILSNQIDSKISNSPKSMVPNKGNNCPTPSSAQADLKSGTTRLLPRSNQVWLKDMELPQLFVD